MTESESAPVCQTCGTPANSNAHYFGEGQSPRAHEFVPERAGDTVIVSGKREEPIRIVHKDGEFLREKPRAGDDEARPKVMWIECADCDKGAQVITGAEMRRFEYEHARQTGHGSFNVGPYSPAPSGDKPVTSPDLDAACEAIYQLFRGGRTGAHVKAIDDLVAAARAAERAAAAERERGLREALELIAGAESLTAKGCARVAREALEKFHAAVSGEGEGQ